MRFARHAVAMAMVAMLGCTTIRTGVAPDVDLQRDRHVHMLPGCLPAEAAALRNGLARRGIVVSEGPPDTMPADTDLRVECERTLWDVKSIWSPTGEVSYLWRFFVVFIEAHDDAVVATGEFLVRRPWHSGSVEEPIEHILTGLYRSD